MNDLMDETGIIAVLLVPSWNRVLFVDKDVLSDGLGIEIYLWNGGTGGLLSGGETDVLIQEEARCWLEAHGCW
jgi:hypothetical protein